MIQYGKYKFGGITLKKVILGMGMLISGVISTFGFLFLNYSAGNKIGTIIANGEIIFLLGFIILSIIGLSIGIYYASDKRK